VDVALGKGQGFHGYAIREGNFGMLVGILASVFCEEKRGSFFNWPCVLMISERKQGWLKGSTGYKFQDHDHYFWIMVLLFSLVLLYNE